MGVPGFYKWLCNKYKRDTRFMMENLHNRPNVLLLDSNCLFHPQCFKILSFLTNETRVDKLEKIMIKRIMNYISYLIGFVNPIDTVYISVDGVAPLAKMGQQRKRRSRAKDDATMKFDLMKKYKIPHNSSWSNVVITPGTEFMNKLHHALRKYCSNRTNIDIIYSSYHTPGEGEHKILQYIKTLDETQSVVIYGLDADLIFLSMASQRENIYLLRESAQLGINTGKEEILDPVTDVAEMLMYVSIDEVKKCYIEQLTEMFAEKNVIPPSSIIDDFIFICYLLGNDFLPHFPSLNIHNDGLDILINIYLDLYIERKDSIITFTEEKKVKINSAFVIDILKTLGSQEKNYFQIELPIHKEKQAKRRCFGQDAYSREMWMIENMRVFNVVDYIKLGEGEEDEWKFRYYEHYFRSIEHQSETVDAICKNYIDGLVWVTRYYFERCRSWRWQYYPTHAPFISDLYQYIIKNNVNLNDIMFPQDKPINMPNQLLSVLPACCSNILPKSFRHLVTSDESPIIDMFPMSVALDMINKDQYYQCIPMIPYLDIDRIEEATKDIKITVEEEKRFASYKEYKYKKVEKPKKS